MSPGPSSQVTQAVTTCTNAGVARTGLSSAKSGLAAFQWPQGPVRSCLPPRWVPLHSSFSEPGSSAPPLSLLRPDLRKGFDGFALGGILMAVGDWRNLNVDCVAPSGHWKSECSQRVPSGILGIQGWAPKGSIVCAHKLEHWEKKAQICNFRWVH